MNLSLSQSKAANQLHFVHSLILAIHLQRSMNCFRVYRDALSRVVGKWAKVMGLDGYSFSLSRRRSARRRRLKLRWSQDVELFTERLVTLEDGYDNTVSLTLKEALYALQRKQVGLI